MEESSSASPYSSVDPVHSIAIGSSQSVVALAHRTHVSVVRVTCDAVADHCSVQPSFKGNFTLTDVAWSPGEETKLAVSATAGSMAVVDISYVSGRKPKPIWDSGDGTRAINKICWHPRDASVLCSASQDGVVRLYDQRLKKNNVTAFTNRSDSVALRDVQFDPFHDAFLATVSDNGNLLVWDIRSNEAPYVKIAAHTSVSQTLSWNPEKANRIATGGRDRAVKVWDLYGVDDAHHMRPTHSIQTSTGVARLRWRRRFSEQMAVSLVDKPEVLVFDVLRPHLPACVLRGHTEACSDFDWIDAPLAEAALSGAAEATRRKTDAAPGSWSTAAKEQLFQHVFSVDKDGRVAVQDVREAFFPAQHCASSVAAVACTGAVAYHQGDCDRSNVLGLVCETGATGKLFADVPSKFGMAFPTLASAPRPSSANEHSTPSPYAVPDRRRTTSPKINHSLVQRSEGAFGAASPSNSSVAPNSPAVSGQPASPLSTPLKSVLGHIFVSSFQALSDESILIHLATNYRYRDATMSGIECCNYNKQVVLQLGLIQRSAVWSTMEILLPQLTSKANLVSMQLLCSLLGEVLDNGDCQIFVACVEIIRQEQSIDGLAIPRLREGYSAYIELLNQFGLYSLAASLLKNSEDDYLIQQGKAGVLIYSSCSLCGKELSEGVLSAWCIKCQRTAAICALCEEPVRGLLHWCPVCAHGGHTECMQRWFSACGPSGGACATGCGHNCRRPSETEFAVVIGRVKLRSARSPRRR